jgi:ubiquinone/menaquinone biosynthesis C-methylase UbiE
MTHLNSLNSDDLERLNRTTIRDVAEIYALMVRASSSGVVFSGGINRRNEARTARIEDISHDRLTLIAKNFDQSTGGQIYINFEHDGAQYFFAASQVGKEGRSRVTIRMPDAVYKAERRNRNRQPATTATGGMPTVEVRLGDGAPRIGKVVDWSRNGVGVEVPLSGTVSSATRCDVRFVDGPRKGERSRANVRHSAPGSLVGGGWVRLGLSLADDDQLGRVEVDRRSRIVSKSGVERIREQAALLNAALRSVPGRISNHHWRNRNVSVPVQIETLVNQKGQKIKAIIDRWGDSAEATAVIIPPAWGRTKETLLPLALTVKETFKRSGKPVVIVRFDGTNRRGESHVDLVNRQPGDEYLGFTFSQASQDIVAVMNFLDNSTKFTFSRMILATFSLSSIEARHVLASTEGDRLSGWVSAVGMVDLQSALKTISGGVDYAFGLLKGVHFGRHELVGVVADMDKTGLNAIEHEMAFLEDAKREMASIAVPITWIHGRDDAWMSLDRVRDVLSCGDASERRLIEVPTGHQLRTSGEAMATFQLVAEEISEMALGTRLRAVLPDLKELSERNAAERARRPQADVDLRSFWGDYLLGRDRRYGIQLLTATRAYLDLMDAQVEEIGIQPGNRVADLGAGTGEFASHLINRGLDPREFTVHEVDFVMEALQRREGQRGSASVHHRGGISRVVADLNVSGKLSVPLKSETYDGVIASLVVSYLREPVRLLEEAYRILKPGGSIVVSTLRRDADISKLYVEGLSELRAFGGADRFGDGDAGAFDDLSRGFLNDASRILDYEEEGHFQFWESGEFEELVRSAGFVRLKTRLFLGDPPQAIVMSAVRPELNKSSSE